MSSKGIGVAAFLAERSGANLGAFTGLNFGPGLSVTEQGPTLQVDANAAAIVATTRRSVVFKPGAPSAGDTVETWAEVAALIASTDGLLDVYVDSSLATPTVGSSVNCKGKTNFLGVIPQYLPAGSGQTNLAFAAGALITDPARFENVALLGTGNDLMIRTTIAGFILTFFQSGIIVPTNNVPALAIAGDNSLIVWDSSGVAGAFPAVDAYIEIEASVLYVFMSLFQALFYAPDNVLAVKGTGIVLNVLTDGSVYLPTQTQLVASTQTQGIVANVQTGLTAGRPTNPPVGGSYYDQTLSKPIWWTGAAWTLADGTVV